MLHLKSLLLGLILTCAVCESGLRTLCPAFATSSCLLEEARAAATDGAYYWNQQKGGPARTGYSPFPVIADLTRGPTWQWRNPQNETMRTTPLIDDKLNIYLSTLAGRIYKLSQDGQILWTYEAVNESLPGVSALLDGKLFASTRSGHVFAIDMERGSEIWKVRISRETGGDGVSIFAFNNTVILATHLPRPVLPDLVNHGNSKVVALYAHDGSVKWMFHPDTYVYNFQASSPGDGSVIFQDKSGGLYCVSIDDGHLLWRSGMLKREWTSSGASVVDDGLVFSLSNLRSRGIPWDIGVLMTHRLADGQQLYFQILTIAANQAPAVGQLSRGGKLSVVAAIGENSPLEVIMRWLDVGWPMWIALPVHLISMLSPRSWFESKVRATIVAFDAETGNVQWRHELGLAPHEVGQNGCAAACLHAPCSQPVIGGDGTVYVVCGSGKVYAIRDVNGDGSIDPTSESSSFDLGDGWQGSLAIAPGLLAVASCGGALHVFKP